MPIIRVDPSILNNSANNVNNSAGGITNAGNNANSAAASAPSYDGQFGPKVKAIGNEARAIANGNAENLLNKSNELMERAKVFLAADTIALTSKYWQSLNPIVLWQPANLLSIASLELLRLGSLKLSDLQWLKIFKPNSSLPSWKTKPTNVSESPKRDYFGDLVKKAKLEEAERKKKELELIAIQEKKKKEQELAAQREKKKKQESPVEFPETSEDWQSLYDVKPQSQLGLKYGEGTTAFGCVPTSTSMILNYWHEKDSTNATISSQDLINSNVKQNQFDKKGMSASDVKDDLDKIGYTATDHSNSNIDTLKSELKSGPVIAIVKLNMATTGNNHAVVVSGISESNEVRVVDPWTGNAKTYSWDTFSKSWGANFGKGTPKNNLVSIHPK